MHRKTIVSNYFISPEHSVAVPRAFTSSAPPEEISLSDTPSHHSATIVPGAVGTHQTALANLSSKRGRESSWQGRYYNNSLGEISTGFVGAEGTTHPGNVPNPYDEFHQGPLQPPGSAVERATYSESMDAYRHAKLPCREPITPAVTNGSGDAGSYRAIRNDLLRLQEQCDKLSKVVEETQEGLRRSQEENNLLKRQSEESVTELRLEVARLSKHVQLLEEKSTSIEQSLGPLDGTQRVVECLQKDLTPLRQQVCRNTTTVAVLEKLLEDVRHQVRLAPPVANSAGSGASVIPFGITASPSAASEPSTTPKATGIFSADRTGTTAGSASTSHGLFGGAQPRAADDESAVGTKSTRNFSFGGSGADAASGDGATASLGVGKPAGESVGGPTTSPKPFAAFSTGGTSTTNAANNILLSPFDNAPAIRRENGPETTQAPASCFTFGGSGAANTPLTNQSTSPGTSATATSGTPQFGGGGTNAPLNCNSFGFGSAHEPGNAAKETNTTAVGAPGRGGGFPFPPSSATPQASEAAVPEAKKDYFSNTNPFTTSTGPFASSANAPLAAISPAPFGTPAGNPNPFAPMQGSGSPESNSDASQGERCAAPASRKKMVRRY